MDKNNDEILDALPVVAATINGIALRIADIMSWIQAESGGQALQLSAAQIGATQFTNIA